MYAHRALCLLACGFVVMPHFIFAAPVINEVLFDPAGTDTGLEAVEIFNPDLSAADVSGWELYPDGIGYFVFPSGFSVAAQSFAVVHLRSSGAADDQNLYHASATANMGNSSGSLALFRTGGRTKDTIVDFVRYHKPGSAERKTWESTAADAGLWTPGTFVEISNVGEGNTIGLASDGTRAAAAAGWKVFILPSIGALNAIASATSPPPASSESSATASTTFPLPSDSGRSLRPSLGADAGPDTTVIAGAVVPFHGVALGLNRELLPTAGFLWNFGDGAVEPGKALTHIYHFPGTYRVNLSVSSGEYSGSDWRTITVLAPVLTISEVKPGQDGFVELFNAAADTVDLGGINFTDQRGKMFLIPAGTMVGPESALVFANALTGLASPSMLTLRDARSIILDDVRLPDVLPPGASWEWSGDRFVAEFAPTPGSVVRRAPARESPSPSLAGVGAGWQSPPRPATASPARIATSERGQTEATGGGEAAARQGAAAISRQRGLGASSASGSFFFTAGILGSFLAAAAFFVLKRTIR